MIPEIPEGKGRLIIGFYRYEALDMPYPIPAEG